MATRPLRYRHIHLDFHTSEYIPHVGADFDPDEFVAALQSADVDSITLFAKCHHGWSYYPTTIGEPHPQLECPDLLGEMMRACAKVDIETPVYISVQWDERNARLHTEWRAMSATNRVLATHLDEISAQNQFSAIWHTLCLNNAPYRQELQKQASEIVAAYAPPGLFFDIVNPTDCVCPRCLDRLLAAGRNPENPADRHANDIEINEAFRVEMTAFLHDLDPKLRIFYNSGHIAKKGRATFETYTHLELESLPTGGWGYDHFPSSARYAATLQMDFLAHTGKFHSSWGEFGGFKSVQALDYECAQMAALGAKCLIGDQLHPCGRINGDTYASLAPAYARIKTMEPYLKDAVQLSEVAILAAEFYQHGGGATRNNLADDGAVQMLGELHRPFDVIDETADFSRYRLIIMPDEIPLNDLLKEKIDHFCQAGGAILLTSCSGLDPDTGDFGLDVGVHHTGQQAGFNPLYFQKTHGESFCPKLPNEPFVVYSDAELVRPAGAKVLLDLKEPYFNRSYRQFCSHKQAPDDPHAKTPGPAVTLCGRIGYVSAPLFSAYRQAGQPLYKYIVDALIDKLIPDPLLRTNLPSAGRVSITRQAKHFRDIIHLLYATPQIRGRAMNVFRSSGPQIMEMIEDIPRIGPVTVKLRMDAPPAAVKDVMTEAIVDSTFSDGHLHITFPYLHIYAGLVIEK